MPAGRTHHASVAGHIVVAGDAPTRPFDWLIRFNVHQKEVNCFVDEDDVDRRQDFDHTRFGGRLRIVVCAVNEANHDYKKK